MLFRSVFFFQAEDGIRDSRVTGVQNVCSSDLEKALEVLKTFTGKRAVICVGGGSMKCFGFLDKATLVLGDLIVEIQTGRYVGQGGHEPYFVDAWQLAVWSFPRDRKLTGLVALGEADARRRLLQDLLPAMPELWPAGMETLRYKNERRYVGKLLVGGAARVLIKVYEARDFKNACRAAPTQIGRASCRERV